MPKPEKGQIKHGETRNHGQMCVQSAIVNEYQRIVEVLNDWTDCFRAHSY